jgi:hypothetical protein
VNAVSPGHIDTPIFEGWQQGDGLTKMKEELAKNVPLAGWEIQTKSPKPLHFSRQMRRVTSLGLNCSMAASPRSDSSQRKEAT